MRDLHLLWGCGRGPIKHLHPHIRILSGVLIAISCMSMPLQSPYGIIAIVISVGCWCGCAALPKKVFFQYLIASSVLYFPFLLLTPWISVDSISASPPMDRIMQAVAIALRSTSIFLITASTIGVLNIYDVQRGLAHMPIPKSIAALIIQLISQTMLLIEETSRIIGVLRLRHASGFRGIRVLFSFPVVWMVRMLFRAERSAAAMTVRGYGIEHVVSKEKDKLTIADRLAIFLASAFFIVSIFFRLRVLL